MIRNKVVEGGPALRIPAHLSFGQHIIDCLRKYGESDDVALINGDNEETTSYKEILQGTVDVALGLQKLGVRKGDVIALCGENIAEYIMSALGAVCSGATITTLNLMYTEDELKHVLSISKPKYIFCSEAAIKLHLKTLKSIPSLVKIIQLNGIPSRSSILPFSALKVPGDVKTYQPSNLQSGHDTVYILYSSGTTGLPKGVMLTHINTLYSTALFESEVDLDDPSAALSIAPWYHAYGLMATTNDILVKRKLVYFSSGFNPQKYLGCIQKYKTRTLLAVPPIVVFLAKSPLIDQYDLSSVEIVWCGAAPLSSETIQAALKRLPNCKGVFQGYGMTETALTATKDKHDVDIRKPGCGGYPMPGLKIKVVNIETREKLGPYAEGEVCITGPTIMKGYLGNRKETKDMFDEEGFMKTGDIGYYDNEGCFFIVDRLKELIKYKGYQVAPAAVESVILQHSGVAECGVVGKPDEKVGELPVAFVVPKPGVELTPKDILDFTNDKLSSSSRLHGGVIIVKEIPKNQSGKILRRVLKQHFKTGKKSKL